MIPEYLQIEIAKGRLCKCGHHGTEHAGTEPRVCKICYNCYAFKTQNEYSDMLSKIDMFVEQFDTWDKRINWICENMPFTLGLDNNSFLFWYWKYIYPKWDPETEFLDEDRKRAIASNAKAEVVIRAFRLYREHNPDKVEKFKNLQMWRGFNEAGYREAAIDKKLGI